MLENLQPLKCEYQLNATFGQKDAKQGDVYRNIKTVPTLTCLHISYIYTMYMLATRSKIWH